jgi:diaminohydroxyphosphoribosylaminopyrimidine deaminase/5-amino-6-(5-phosphoribosylamino)uracil reductase
MDFNEIYMARALELARHGAPNTSPNPMVGAVITAPDGRIIGEGYHRRVGEGHAEVNAINSVAPEDLHLLEHSTMYVTLEPCSHVGRTPACAALIISRRIPRVVVGCLDPFEKVSGRGVKMLRDAGVEVATGVLEHECRSLNAVFMTAHSLRRPFVTLKWAQSADGYLDYRRIPGEKAAMFSGPLGLTLVHRLRAMHDAILVGASTVIADNPSLDTRYWPGRSPMRVVLDRRHRIPADCKCLSNSGECLVLDGDTSPAAVLDELYRRGVTSVLVEGGAQVLKSFIDSGLWDHARVETAPIVLGDRGTTPAPCINMPPTRILEIGKNVVKHYSQNALFDVKNI